MTWASLSQPKKGVYIEYGFENGITCGYIFNTVIYIFLLLSLCILIVCLYMATLSEVLPRFFFSCKANARVKAAKTGHKPHSSQFLCCFMYFCFVSFCVLFVCICVLCYCHRVAIQLQLTNISYHGH